MDIGNGNIASVRLTSIFARIGTLGLKNMQTKIQSLSCEHIHPSRCKVVWSRLSNPGVPKVAVTIIFRVLVGIVCDILGARRGLAFLLFLACPGIVGMMSATEQEWMVGYEVEIAV